MDEYPTPESRIQHLQMIQDVISRLGGNGFLVKGSAVTVTSGFLGFAVSNDKWALAVASYVPIVAFWTLDGFFLRAERLFRHLYDLVRDSDPEVKPFFMSAPAPEFTKVLVKRGTGPESWPRTMTRAALVTFYGALAGAAGGVGLLIGCG